MRKRGRNLWFHVLSFLQKLFVDFQRPTRDKRQFRQL